MYRIRFRNGVDAVETLLTDDEGRLLNFETEKEARSQLDELARKFGTVDDAAAWVDGDDPPKHLRPVAEEWPEVDAPAEEPVAEAAEEEPDTTAAAAELAEAEGVDLAEVTGTGAGGRVTKADVEKAVEDRSA